MSDYLPREQTFKGGGFLTKTIFLDVVFISSFYLRMLAGSGIIPVSVVHVYSFFISLAFADEIDMIVYLRQRVSRLWIKVKAISKAVCLCILFLSMEAVIDVSGFVFL